MVSKDKKDSKVGDGLRGFDPHAFFGRIVSTVQKMRSQYTAKPGVDFYSPKEVPSASSGESPLNALYRALGLPAVRHLPSTELGEVEAGSRLRNVDYDGTLNFFQIISEVGDYEGGDRIAREVLLREQAWHHDSYGEVPKTKANIIRGLQFMYSPLKINNFENNIGRRPSLFPMVVCGDVPVFPVSRRVAPLFFDGGDYTPTDTRLPRSFLEGVIFNRLFEFDVVGEEGDAAAISFRVQGEMIDALESALAQTAQAYLAAASRIREHLKKVIYVPALVYGVDPSLMVGRLDVSLEELAAISEELKKTPEVGVTDVVRPSLEVQLVEIEEKIEEERRVYGALPTVGRAESDSFRLEAQLPEYTVVSDFFIGDLLDIIASGVRELEREKATLEKQISTVRGQLERDRAFVDMCSGISLGFGFFDVVAIFLAFHKLDLEVLLGLLNEEAKSRLFSVNQRHKYTVPAPNNIPDVHAALIALESEVKEILNKAQDSQRGERK